MSYAKSTKSYKSNRPQPVTRKVDKKQVKNTQGLYVYKTEDMTQLVRFLILGTTAPTYHAGTKNVGKNVALVEKVVQSNGVEVVNTVARLDRDNVLIRKDQALFVLAYALQKGSLETRRQAAFTAAKIIRTGRDVANFVTELNDLGGWGRLKRETVAQFYQQDIGRLDYQVAKYRNTTGQWSHKNVMRLAHPVPPTEQHDNLYAFLVNKEYSLEMLPEKVRITQALNSPDVTEKNVVNAVRQYNLTHEMVPTQFKNSKAVWAALAQKMPFRATVWNLSTFSRLGLLQPMSDFEKMIIERLHNEEQIKGSRVHPFALMVALRNYQSGEGFRNTWTVNRRVVDALEDALEMSLDYVENTGVKYGLVVDTSGSMGFRNMAGSNMKPIEAAAALAAINSRQGDAVVIGVDSRVHPDVRITAKTRISEAIREFGRWHGGSTNLGAGVEYFTQKGIKADVIVVYTDNEVNQGRHAAQLFDEYKRRVNPDAKFVVVAMTANNFSIADASRDDMLDIAGFDTTAPQLIDSFAKGW